MTLSMGVVPGVLRVFGQLGVGKLEVGLKGECASVFLLAQGQRG